MAEIKLNLNEKNAYHYNKYFNPLSTAIQRQPQNKNAKFVCCCGWELIKESGNTWRCTGGNHRYFIGEIIKDINGDILFKKPQNINNANKK